MNSTAIDEFALFSEACGADRLHLEIAQSGGNAASRRALDQPFFVVGRSPDADLMFDHEQVSWRHCYLQLIGGRLVAIDLGSRAGVQIDGATQRNGWIGRENRLHVGPVELRLRASGPEGQSETGEPDWLHPLSARFARGLPPASMEIEGFDGQTYGWRMSRALALIGQSPSCQLRFVNPLVSKFHAALVRTPKGVWVVDLLSREGIEVDGNLVRAARLEEGSTCQVGPFALRIRHETAARALPRATVAPRALPVPAVREMQTSAAVCLPAETRGGAPAPVSLTSEWTIDPAGAQPALRGETLGESGQPQQVMMMLAQLLGTMHSDHMNLVRDELAEIRRLAEEMHALRVEMGRRSAEAPAPAGLPAAAPAEQVQPGEPPMPDLEPPLPRDPRECLAIASDFLAEYERKQNGYLNRMLRLVKGVVQGPESASGPLDPAPLR